MALRLAPLFAPEHEFFRRLRPAADQRGHMYCENACVARNLLTLRCCQLPHESREISVRNRVVYIRGEGEIVSRRAWV